MENNINNNEAIAHLLTASSYSDAIMEALEKFNPSTEDSLTGVSIFLAHLFHKAGMKEPAIAKAISTMHNIVTSYTELIDAKESIVNDIIKEK